MAQANTATKPKTRKCIAPGCNYELSMRAQKCSQCGTLQRPARSGRWKRRWKKISTWWGTLSTSTRRFLATIAVVIAGVATAATQMQTIIDFWHKNFGSSHTVVIVTSAASPDEIFVNIQNTGFRDSTLVGYKLTFSGVPIEPRTLHLVDDDRNNIIVPAQKNLVLHLTASGLRPLYRDGTSERLTKAEIMPKLDAGQTTLEVEVQESDGLQRRSDTFSATRLRAFIQEKVPDYGQS
jgi:hypothetical protein